MADIINTVKEYIDKQGNSPYSSWLKLLPDERAKVKIVIQVDRMELGLFGDSQPIVDGLSELRIHYGKGYRIYYGKEKQHIYLLLCGGNKSSQKKDIKLAKSYWEKHKRRK